ncbi:voltage-gated potassium channel Kch [Sphingomonas carotinifaciens]|nr:voltage-gated potassium channel Kch [Sphingomonas carotinifaciens]
MPWRASLALALISIALAVHRFDCDGLHRSSGKPVTFADILYFTMITVTTVGYGDIVPVTQRSRLFDTFVSGKRPA